MINGLWVATMGIVIWRRGRPMAIRWLVLGDEFIWVGCWNTTRSFSCESLADMEYTGLRNRARVPVVHAPFPQHDSRVLMITLAEGDELRVKVKYEHDAELKRLAAKWMV